MTSVLFVCLGNICRSPTAHGILEHLISQHQLSARLRVDSAGTGAWHAGETADKRSQQTANRHGISLSSRARQITLEDLEHFDHIFAMDQQNLRSIAQLSSNNEHRRKLRLLRDLDPEAGPNSDTPDPYYGGPGGFEEVFQICLRSCQSLVSELFPELELR